MVTVVADVTALVVIVKYSDIFRPASIVTDAGTAATAGLELTREMAASAGAGSSNCTAFDGTLWPPFTVVSESFTA
jgi:hypothetical protein